MTVAEQPDAPARIRAADRADAVALPAHLGLMLAVRAGRLGQVPIPEERVHRQVEVGVDDQHAAPPWTYSSTSFAGASNFCW